MQASFEIGMETGRALKNVVGGGSAPAIKRGDIPVIDPAMGMNSRPSRAAQAKTSTPIPDEIVAAHPRASCRTG
jgi:hypothetical protein